MCWKLHLFKEVLQSLQSQRCAETFIPPAVTLQPPLPIPLPHPSTCWTLSSRLQYPHPHNFKHRFTHPNFNCHHVLTDVLTQKAKVHDHVSTRTPFLTQLPKFDIRKPATLLTISLSGPPHDVCYLEFWYAWWGEACYCISFMCCMLV